MSVTATAPAILPKANEACWCGSGRKYKRCHKKLEGRVLPGAVTPMRTVPDSNTSFPSAASAAVASA